MTFKKINENEQQNLHDRSCMILVNFNAKELAAIKTVSNFAGIRDRIAVTSKNGNTKINDILDGNMLDDNEEVWSEKAIIFNNISATRVSGFLDGLKKKTINCYGYRSINRLETKYINIQLKRREKSNI